MNENISAVIEEIKKYGLLETAAHIGARWGLCDHYTYLEKRIPYYKRLTKAQMKDELTDWYYRHTGIRMDIDHPKTVTEYIQWYKLNDQDTRAVKTRLADKYLVREWIKEKLGEQYLVPIYGVWDSFDEIDFDCIPEGKKFVLKATHGSGMTLVIDDKLTMDRKKTKKTVQRWLSYPYGWDGLELHYLDIPPKIVAEEYIVQENGGLDDYKIHVFRGEIAMIQVYGNRDLERHTATANVYDANWNEIDVPYTVYPLSPVPIPKPTCLTELLSAAQTLGKEFDYVRIDFYVLGNTVKFGEMTFTQDNGLDTGVNGVLQPFFNEIWHEKKMK